MEPVAKGGNSAVPVFSYRCGLPVLSWYKIDLLQQLSRNKYIIYLLDSYETDHRLHCWFCLRLDLVHAECMSLRYCTLKTSANSTVVDHCETD